jgi:hypothetical protein
MLLSVLRHQTRAPGSGAEPVRSGCCSAVLSRGPASVTNRETAAGIDPLGWPTSAKRESSDRVTSVRSLRPRIPKPALPGPNSQPEYRDRNWVITRSWSCCRTGSRRKEGMGQPDRWGEAAPSTVIRNGALCPRFAETERKTSTYLLFVGCATVAHAWWDQQVLA